MNVTLTEDEFLEAVRFGADRRARAIVLKRKQPSSRTYDEGWAQDIGGCIGEAVVAKARGVTYEPGNWTDTSHGDVDGVEVRYSSYDNAHVIAYQKRSG